MLVIRLARVGRKHQASFRLVAAEKLRTPTGKFVDMLGHYNPHSKVFVVDEAKLAKHFKNGAQPSSSVVKLLKRNKIVVPKWAEANLLVKNKPPKVKKKDGDEAAAPAAEASAETADAAEAKAPAGDGAEQPSKPEPAKEKAEPKEPANEAKPAQKDTKAEAKPEKPQEQAKPTEADKK